MKNICLYVWGDCERVIDGGNGDGDVVFIF